MKCGWIEFDERETDWIEDCFDGTTIVCAEEAKPCTKELNQFDQTIDGLDDDRSVTVLHI